MTFKGKDGQVRQKRNKNLLKIILIVNLAVKARYVNQVNQVSISFAQGQAVSLYSHS